MALQIVAVEGTDFFEGDESRLRQVLLVAVSGAQPTSALTVTARDGGTGNAGEATAHVDTSGTARVPVTIDWVATESGTREVAITVSAGRHSASGTHTVRAGTPGWTLHLVPHFHYDPVWWNTQGSFVSEWETMPLSLASRGIDAQRNAFELMRQHLDKVAAEPEYKFVISEVDYLKPWWAAHPQRRAELVDAIRSGRVEVLGGSYNEPQTNLISPETTTRSAIYGLAYQRDLLGGDPTIAWQLDVFGHDPQYPAIMADAGLTRTSWARGPHHEWGPMLPTGGNANFSDPIGMQFDSEFFWMSPSGRGLLTSYMAAHYSAGWWMDAAPTLQAAESQVYDLFARLQEAAAAPTVMIPVGMDHSEPNRWVTDIQRDWSNRFVWPKTLLSTPREYFEDFERSGVVVTTQTRDMNPIFSGTHVSFIDTKQAHRAAENLLLDAEKFATFAARDGAIAYPRAELDHAWRQLVFASHHDAITGSESDQVYVDLLGSWREAWSLAAKLHHRATAALAGGSAGDTSAAITVFNPVSAERRDAVTVRLPGPDSAVLDETGAVVPTVAERSADGSWRATFLADGVPSLGYRTYRVSEAGGGRWRPLDATTIENEHLSVELDAARGGGIASMVDRATGRQLVTAGALANEILIYDEYPNKPLNNELGPWYINPTGGPRLRSGSVRAVVTAETSAVGERLTVTGSLGSLRFVQRITLWRGSRRLECTTELHDFTGSDELIRIAWPCDIPGALPLAETGTAVIGRGFAHPNEDAAEHARLYDAACYQWFGLGSTARLRLLGTGGADGATSRAIGVAEIVCSSLAESASSGTNLARALVKSGVTSTNTLAGGARYGDPRYDSNSPDVRFAVGTPETNDFVREVLDRADAGVRAEFERQLSVDGHALVYAPAAAGLRSTWRPSAAVTGVDDLPVVLLSDATVVERVCEDLDDFIIDIQTGSLAGPVESADDYTVALLNRGTPSSAVDVEGTLYLSVLRSCTGWPSGVWLNPPTRRVPDGSAFQLQHWSHSFDYAFVAGAGDWRDLDLSGEAHEYNHPLTAAGSDGSAGSRSLLALEPASGVVATSVSERPDGAISVRLAEGHGVDRSIALRLESAHAAQHTDLVGAELSTGGSELETADDTIRTRVTGYDVRTLSVTTDRAAAASPRDPAPRTAPLASRYWLGSTGAAPLGDLPFSVTVSETARLEDGRLHTSVIVARESDAGRGTGSLTARVLGGAATLVGEDRWDVDLTSESYREFPLVLDTSSDGTVMLECVAEFTGASGSVADARAFRTADGSLEPFDDLAARVDVGWPSDEIVLRAGEERTIPVRITNSAPFEIRGDVQLLSPWGTWEWLDEWTREFAVAAGASVDVEFRFSAPADAVADFGAWALAKVVWLGAVNYSPATGLRITNS